MLKVGVFIQNRYEIISRIGSGGMADVYKAKDHKLNRFVAVKVLKKEFRDDKAFISKFRVEAQSAAGLAHANIVNIYDTGEENGIYYIVMELVDGITLKEYIEKKGRLSVREATSIALQISAGLEAAHNNGIIHRDVKPQNIMISTDGKVKVADFGIARASTSNTINSSVMGSVHYSSPEQSRGGYSDAKSDIYSLGITMYEMLTGRVPFDGDTAVSVAIKHLQEELRGPKELVPEIPVSTNQIVIKCTQKSPDRRYANMSELIRDLRESLVNPDGNFVTQQTVDHKSKTRIMSKEEVSQINAERTMPSYDESLDVGAAARLQGQTYGNDRSRAYQPGSYYQKTGYQEVMQPPLDEDDGRWDSEYEFPESPGRNYDPYYDAYDDPQDYGFQENDYKLEEDNFSRRRKAREDRDNDIGINPKLEKAVTVGGIIVAVIIGCVFLSLLANAFGLFNFARRDRERKQSERVTEKRVTEKTEEKTADEPADAETVEVPQLTGRTESEAQKLLQDQGLSGEKSGEEESQEQEAGTIIRQDPAAGTGVAPGSKVSYIVNSYQGIVLQSLANEEKSTAQAYLLTQGLQCVIDETRYSDTVAAGYVISTDPEAGTVLQPNDMVTLYVSQGKGADAPQVDVPDCYYCDEDITTQRCELYGLGVPNFEYEASNAVNKGFVIRQDPAAGTSVPEGTVVTFVVSTGPSASQDDISINTGSGEIWKCNASLSTPEGYAGENVRIDLEQDGVVKTIFTGQTTFPYQLSVQGADGVETGTAYVYLLNEAGEAIRTIEYPGITFSRTGG